MRSAYEKEITMRLALLLSIPLFTVAAHADTKPAEIRLQISWHLTVDASGHVTELEPIKNARADRVPQIRQRVEEALRGWEFVPGKVDGKPVGSKTLLTLDLTVLPQDADSVRLRIDAARTGGHVLQYVPPHYPMAAIKAHQTGMVVLQVAYDGSGKVTSAAPAPGAPKVSSALVEASIAAAMKWTFEPERVDGHGVAGNIYSPLCYSLFPEGSRPASGAVCEWIPPGQTKPIGEGQALALNPETRLATDVTGRVL
jgi:TonB family protein